MKLFKAMATVAGLTFVSRILGFVRDILTAAIMGAGPLADAFFVALKLPNLFRRITAEGAFSVSFVPLFSESMEKEGREAAVAMARTMMGWMFVILTIFSVIAIAAMPYIVLAIAPGFEKGDMRFATAVDLARITFPYLLLISLAALIGGVMNTIGRFAAYAFAPALFNVVLIAALLMHEQVWQTPAHALAWGVCIAGAVQLAWMWIYARRCGVTLYPARPVLTDRVRRLGILMIPGLVGAGVYHLNLFADMIIASFLPAGSISYLYYADRLQQLPLGVVGIAVGTALLPLLSRAIAADKMEEARGLFNRAMEAVFLLALPAALALLVAAEPIIRSLFQYGAFSESNALTTGFVLQCYAVGLPAYIAARVFQSACFARQDTKTPVRIAIACALVNIVLALILSRFIGVAGIALSTGIAGWVQIGLFYAALRGRGILDFDARLIRNIWKITVSALIMALGIFVFVTALSDVFENQGPARLIALAALVGGGGALYGLSIFTLGGMTIQDIKSLFNKER